jgi:hypothetical protein
MNNRTFIELESGGRDGVFVDDEESDVELPPANCKRRKIK